VFRAVFRSINTFRHETKNDTFRGWLRTITRNKTLDFFRQQRADSVAPGGSDAHDVLQNLPFLQNDASSEAEDNQERLQLLRRAIELTLEDCEEHTRQIFYRIVLGNQAVADVAQELGVTANVVYIAKSRLLNRLRGEFAHLLEPVDLAGPADES
jgi:RNA polymerase sigma-70 factor (ECF subfamily)